MDHPSEISAAQPAETPKPDRFPVGIGFLSFYIGYSLLARLWGIQAPALLFGPFVFGKVIAISYALVSVVILSISLYGVVTRRKWARPIVLGWFSFQIFYGLIEFLLAFAYRVEVVELYRRMFPQQEGIDEFTIMLGKVGIVAFILIVNTIVCWYVYSMRSFFVR